MTTVTVLSGRERRRRWSSAEKLRIVEESLAGGASIVEVARRHDVHPNLLHLWRRQARAEILSATEGDPRFVPVAVAARGALRPEPVSGACGVRRSGDRGGAAQTAVCCVWVRAHALPSTLLTDFAYHRPPRGVLMPRAFSASAIWCRDVAPARCISRMIGSTLAA
jgi:transposase-like protein